MSIKVRAKIHPFKNAAAEFYRETAPLSEIFADLNSPLDITHARFLIDDEMTADINRTPPDGSTVYINIVPEGNGDQVEDAGKRVFWTGVGTTILGVAALFIPVAGIALGSAMIGSGVSMMLGGAVLLNTEIPTPSVSSRETGSQLESIRGSKNQTRKLGYIPVLFGRHLVTPDAAAPPYTEIDADGQQWLTQLFCAGYNDMAIETGSFKVGDTALAELSETKNINAVLAGTDGRVKLEIIQNGAASALYPRICVEQQYNSIIKNKEETKDGGDIPAPIVFTTPDKTTGINVDILFPMGLAAYNDNGDKTTASVSVSIQYKAESASNYTGFPGWDKDISGADVDSFRRQAAVSGLSPGKYTVRITRETPDSTGTKTINTVYAGSIRSFADDPPVRKEAAQDLVIIALKIKASAWANGVVDNFNFIAQSKIPDYNPAGNTWTARLTQNPASMLLYALQGKINPAPVADTGIDWDSLAEFWTFCNDKGYTCNAVQGDRDLFSVLCAKIAKTGRASILRMDGKFSVVVDRERPAPVQLFSPRNTAGYRQTIVKADVPDEIAVEFIDETKGWIPNERSVYHTSSGLPAGTEKTKQSSSIWGITNPDTIFKFARYQYGCITNRPFIHTLECDIEYLLSGKGDLVEYAGDTALTGIAYGKVTRVILYEGAAIGIAADTVFPQEAGKTYGIRCRKSSGALITLNVVNRETAGRDLSFESPQAADILEEGDLVIFGLTGKITRQLIITEIAPADNFRATLTCVDYSPEIFGVDDPAYEVPPFDNKITTLGGVTDSGIVNTEEWQTWFTYHDSSMSPPKPSGGGTTGGWHRYRTPESRWVSRKTAASITGGDWSIPAQTSFMVDEALRGIIAGTADVGRPGALTGLKALAGKDAVHITWNPLGGGLANDIKHIRVEIKKTAQGDWQAFEVRGGDLLYNFDRAADGYPEASDLAVWRIRAKAVNIYGQESAAYSPGAGGLAVETSGYGSWLPVVPALTVSGSGRTIGLTAPPQAWYGAAGCEYQISKPVQGTPWYAPAMADTETVYRDAGSWKGEEGGVYAAVQLTQQLPLEGQDAGTPKDTAYKYRARSLTKAYDGSVLYRSGWSQEAAALAKGTGIRDVVEAAVGNAQLGPKAVTGDKVEDETLGYGNFVPSVKPPRKVNALPEYPYSGYIQGDTVILISGATVNDEKLYRLVNPAAAGTAGWSSRVDGADLIDETIAIAKMASGTRPTRTVSALPDPSDAGYKVGDTVVLLGDSKVYRLTSAGWTKTLDGVDILANSIQAGSLNVLARNVINPMTDGLADGWSLGPGCSIVEDAGSGLKVLLLVDDAAGAVKINSDSNRFDVLPGDIYVVKFGVECLTAGLPAGQGIFIGVGPAYGAVYYKQWVFDLSGKRWAPAVESTNNPYFLTDYRITARNNYTTYILGTSANIQDVPAPGYTDDTRPIYCIQLVDTVSCAFRTGWNDPTAPRAFKLICPQIYRLGSGRIIAENIIAHSITANEMAAHTLTANEVAAKTLTAGEIAARTLTGDEMAMNTITTKNLAIGDFTNYATVNENIPASMLPAGFILGQTLIDGGYIVKGKPDDKNLAFNDFPEGTLRAGDEYYFEFSAKATAANIGTMYAFGYSAINRVDGVVIDRTIAATYQSGAISLTATEQRFTGTIKITSTVPSVKFIVFSFYNTSAGVQVYFKNVIIRKKNAGEMIVDGSIKTGHMEAGSIDADRIRAGSITGDLIKANTIYAESLNVLAKNVINPFVNGTKEGWFTSAPVVNVEGLGYVLKLSQASGKDFLSSPFAVLPDDIYVFKFGIESLIELSEYLGLYLGLSLGNTFNIYKYDFTNKKWVSNGATNNAYVLPDCRHTGRRYYTTYILGSRANISSVPALRYTDTAYPIYCLQLTGTDTECWIRSGYNNGQPADAAWYLIQPQVYRIGDGGIVAENIAARDLSAISASLGRVTGDGNPDDSQYKLVLSEGFSGNENAKGTFLLGAQTDAAYLRRWFDGSVWHMAIKLATFIVDSIASNIFGRLRAFRTGQNSDADLPVFDTNPGADPQGQAVNHASSEFRGAFRVRKSNNPLYPGCNDPVFEALPNGDVNIPGSFFAGRRIYNSPAQTTVIPAQSGNAFYIKIGTLSYTFGGKLLIWESGDSVAGSFFIDIFGGSPETRKITITFNKFSVYYGIVGFILTAPGGTAWNKDMELWIKVNVSPATENFFMTHLSEVAFGDMIIAGANYQTGAPPNITETIELTKVGGIVTSGQVKANDIIAVNTLSAEGGAKIAGPLTVGGGAKIAGPLTVGPENDSHTVKNGDMIEFWQGGVMVLRIKLAAVSGLMGLLVSGLISCEGVVSSGDIKEEIIDATTAWTAAGSSTFGNTVIRDITYGDGKFLAVGTSGKMAYSANGINWTQVNNSTFEEKTINAIAYGGGKFVAGGASNKMAYSTDGINWTPVGNSTFSENNPMYSITYGKGMFVAVGNSGKMSYSADGTNWTPVGNSTFGTNMISDITCNEILFVAVGENGQTAISADGINWTAVNNSTFDGKTILSISYGNGKFVAGGVNGITAYSINGANWIAAANSSLDMYSMAYDGKQFVAGGNSGQTAISADGINWTKVSNLILGGAQVCAIAYGNKKLVAVGLNGTIAYQAAITAKLVFNPNGAVTWVKA